MGNDRRVVVTGLGVVSSLGICWEEWWKNIIAGKSGITETTMFDIPNADYKLAGEVRKVQFKRLIENRKYSNLGRASQFAITAAKLAFDDARLKKRTSRLSRIGTFLGTTMGEPLILEILNSQLVNSSFTKNTPNFVTHYPAQTISYNVAHALKLSGQNLLISNACSAGNYSIGSAYDYIKHGKLSLAIVGGVDSLTRLNQAGFGRLLSLAPEKCQPFDKNRKGLVVGEGAGILLLESLDSALKRKANIYAEIIGYGLSCDAHNMTEPTLEGVSKSIMSAINNSRITVDEVDYICAHGTGTPKNDSNESLAINKIFKNRKVPTSSIKSMLGHTMGAASAIEAVACCLALKTGIVPPTINYETPDSECDIDCVPNNAREINCKIVLNNSFAFGGNNACVVFKRFI